MLTSSSEISVLFRMSLFFFGFSYFEEKIYAFNVEIQKEIDWGFSSRHELYEIRYFRSKLVKTYVIESEATSLIEKSLISIREFFCQ